MNAERRLNPMLSKLWERSRRRLLTFACGFKNALQRSGLILKAVARDITEGELSLRAMSLVYTTLLSIVPLLAVGFSVLKAFGVHNQIEPLLIRFLAPLGEKGIEISNKIIAFVENIQVGVLGFLGLAFLIYTVFSLIQKVELAFNYTWQVRQTRPFLQRFSGYLSVVTLGPFLVVSALGVTAALASTRLVQLMVKKLELDWLLIVLSQALPYLLVIAAFTFFYIIIPNTKVRFRSALVGGIVAGILWETTGWAFATFAANSTKYAAIYSGLAILIFFMIWLYLSWLILLTGASVSFYHQYPEYVRLGHRLPRLDGRAMEKLGLIVAVLIARRYFGGTGPTNSEEIARMIQVPVYAVEKVVEALERAGLIARGNEEQPHLLPARALETITLKEVLRAVREPGEEGSLKADQISNLPDCAALLGTIEQAINDALGETTLRDVVRIA